MAALFSLDQDYGQGLEEDYIYRINDIETSNFFLNSKGVIFIIVYSFISWAIFYTLKAKYISLPSINEDKLKINPENDQSFYTEVRLNKGNDVSKVKTKSKWRKLFENKVTE